MPDVASAERVRAAELLAALSLATDLGVGVHLEHGLHSTLIAMRLGERLGVDAQVASDTYYACMLFHIGCTVDAVIAAETFGDDVALTTHYFPVMFGSRSETMAGVLRALASPDSSPSLRAVQIARGLSKAARQGEPHLAALCEVAQMLVGRLGLPASVRMLFAQLTERWDGKGFPGLARHEGIPLPLRIAHVARDAAFQYMVGGEQRAARVARARGGRAFDPAIATRSLGRGHRLGRPHGAGVGPDHWPADRPDPASHQRGSCDLRACTFPGHDQRGDRGPRPRLHLAVPRPYVRLSG